MNKKEMTNLEQVRALLKQTEVFRAVRTDLPQHVVHMNEGIARGFRYSAQMICEHPSTMEVTSPDGNVTLTTCHICGFTF